MLSQTEYKTRTHIFFLNERKRKFHIAHRGHFKWDDNNNINKSTFNGDAKVKTRCCMHWTVVCLMERDKVERTCSFEHNVIISSLGGLEWHH